MSDKAVTEARQGFNVEGLFGLVIEGKTDLADAEVETLFEVDEGVFAPDGEANLLARYQRAAMAEEEGQDSRRLLLETRRFGAPAQLQGLVIKLKVAKMDHGHGNRGESTVG